MRPGVVPATTSRPDTVTDSVRHTTQAHKRARAGLAHAELTHRRERPHTTHEPPRELCCRECVASPPAARTPQIAQPPAAPTTAARPHTLDRMVHTLQPHLMRAEPPRAATTASKSRVAESRSSATSTASRAAESRAESRAAASRTAESRYAFAGAGAAAGGRFMNVSNLVCRISATGDTLAS